MTCSHDAVQGMLDAHRTRSASHLPALNEPQVNGLMNQGTVMLARRNAPMLNGVRGLFEVVVMVAAKTSFRATLIRLQSKLTVNVLSFQQATMGALEQLFDEAPDMNLIVLSALKKQAAVERSLFLGVSAATSREWSPVTRKRRWLGRIYVAPGAGAQATRSAVENQQMNEINNRSPQA